MAQPILHSSKRHYVNATYILPADTDELQRLNRQHTNITEAYGSLILAEYTPASGDWILDSGTATGAWLVAVANNAPPDTELIGIDISDRLFPTGEVGERIKCYKKSITLQPSTDWTGTFSFIHQRLLFGGLRQDEWPRAISNMYRMLKPGGYVQLGEIGVMQGSPALKRFQAIFDGLATSRNLMQVSLLNIPEMLGREGFKEIIEFPKFFPIGGWAGPLGKLDLDIWLCTARSVKIPVLDAGGFGVVSSEADFDELLKDIERESETTKGCGLDFSYYVARK